MLRKKLGKDLQPVKSHPNPPEQGKSAAGRGFALDK